MLQFAFEYVCCDHLYLLYGRTVELVISHNTLVKTVSDGQDRLAQTVRGLDQWRRSKRTIDKWLPGTGVHFHDSETVLLVSGK